MANLRGRVERGGILVVVLVVIAMAALAGTSATYLARAELETTSVSLRRVQSRALAWSGVQAAMSELARQRESLLNGEQPQVTEQWELFADPSGRRAVVRLVAGPTGAFLTSEQARLDINAATQEMLEGLGLEDELIAALIAARDRRAFGSPLELLQVAGFTPEVLFGEGWEEGESSRRQPAFILPGSESPGALIDRITVFSFDPNVQVGMGPGGAAHSGRLRINLNTPWSERLGTAIDDRFGPGAGQMARGVMNSGTKIDSLGALIQGAAANNADQRLWPVLLDAFTVSDDPYMPGRIDLNTAPAEVLACVPGISPEAAGQIVQQRETVGREDRRTVLWPLERGILNVEEMVQAVDHLTMRSMQWRIVVEGGFVPAEDRRSWQDLEGEVLQDRVVLEAVIDVASARPRVAYLREVTMLSVAMAMAAALEFEEEENTDLWLDEPEEPGVARAEEPGGWAGQPMTSTFGERQGDRASERSILEQALEGPIELDAGEGENSASDRRIGRWTPGPVRKGSEP